MRRVLFRSDITGNRLCDLSSLYFAEDIAPVTIGSSATPVAPAPSSARVPLKTSALPAQCPVCLLAVPRLLFRRRPHNRRLLRLLILVLSC